MESTESRIKSSRLAMPEKGRGGGLGQIIPGLQADNWQMRPRRVGRKMVEIVNGRSTSSICQTQGEEGNSSLGGNSGPKRGVG